MVTAGSAFFCIVTTFYFGFVPSSGLIREGVAFDTSRCPALISRWQVFILDVCVGAGGRGSMGKYFEILNYSHR